MSAVVDDALVERMCKDVVNLFLSMKLGKMTRKVTLEETVSRIGEHVIEDVDTTKIIREMRERPYGY